MPRGDCADCQAAGWVPATLGAPHIPGTDYYDGRDGSIEADDDDEDRIAAEDAILKGIRAGNADA